MNSGAFRSVRVGEKVSSSERSLGIVRPLLYPQTRYDESSALQSSLDALHIATDGAFYEVPIGAQAVPIVPSLKTIETYAAKKKGGIFDMRKAHDVDQSVTDYGHPNEPFALAPLADEFGPIELERIGGGYKVALVLEKNEEHSRSIEAISGRIGEFVVENCGKAGLHEDDCYALELAQDTNPRMVIGFIHAEQLPKNLGEVAREDPFAFYDAAANRYANRYDYGHFDTTTDPPAAINFTASSVWFGALRLASVARGRGPEEDYRQY
jgi:hypothetical protein